MPSLAEWLGIYAAILSTGLAVYEFIKDRRSVTVIVQYFKGTNTADLTVSNTAHRPVVIVALLVGVRDKKEDGRAFWNANPGGENVTAVAKHFLPATLKDGDHFTLALPPAYVEALLRGKNQLRISTRDVEGRYRHGYKLIKHTKKDPKRF
jgi:hypothetical protein